MKYDRDKLIRLRKRLIQYQKSHNLSEQVDKLTDILLEYPLISYVETNVKDIDRKWVTRDWTKTGYGAFGEPEGYSTERILGWDITNLKCVFFTEDNTPILCSNIEIEKLINTVKQAVIESFDI
jgi:hypothetical protein